MLRHRTPYSSQQQDQPDLLDQAPDLVLDSSQQEHVVNQLEQQALQAQQLTRVILSTLLALATLVPLLVLYHPPSSAITALAIIATSLPLLVLSIVLHRVATPPPYPLLLLAPLTISLGFLLFGSDQQPLASRLSWSGPAGLIGLVWFVERRAQDLVDESRGLRELMYEHEGA